MNDDEVKTSTNSPIDIDVLLNDVPVDTFPLTITDLLFPGNYGFCVISNDGKTITYTPNLNYFGTDQCVYKACDEKKRCDIATVTITVTPSSDEPIAVDDNLNTTWNTPMDIFPLDNDFEVPGYPLTIHEIIRSGNNGACVKMNDQVIMYIPDPDFVGTDSCEYEACDIRGLCDTAVISIIIVGPENMPTCKPAGHNKNITMPIISPTPIPTPRYTPAGGRGQTLIPTSKKTNTMSPTEGKADTASPTEGKINTSPPIPGKANTVAPTDSKPITLSPALSSKPSPEPTVNPTDGKVDTSPPADGRADTSAPTSLFYDSPTSSNGTPVPLPIASPVQSVRLGFL